jgi:SAM-dependent methyltransferase
MAKRTSHPDFGLDAPGLVKTFAVVGFVALMLSLAAANLLRPGSIRLLVCILLALATLYACGMAGLMIFWSKIVKVRERDRMLDLLALRGDEHVLDIGCGRGLMMIGAATRLPRGRAMGVDIWQSADQSGNTADATMTNAALSGVADRVDVQTADMRTLPFAAGTFDVVMSHWAVHNLPDAAERERAIAEMCRVLKTEGTILLADIEYRASYAQSLRSLELGRRLISAEPQPH